MEITAANTALRLDDKVYLHIGDLEWHEGTVVGLFQESASKDLYVLRWADVTDSTHRWLFFRVSPRTLQLYLERSLTDEDLMLLDNPDSIQILDLSGNYEVEQVKNTPIDLLQRDYFPSASCYFDETLCPDLPAIKSILRKYSTKTASLRIKRNASPKEISRLLKKHQVKKGDNLQIFTDEHLSASLLFALLILLATVLYNLFSTEQRGNVPGESTIDEGAVPEPSMLPPGLSQYETPSEMELAIEKNFGINLEIKSAA